MNKFKFTFCVAACASTAMGAFPGGIGAAISGVESQAKDLQSQIYGWSSSNGIQGALAIQENFPALQSSVEALSGAVQGKSDSDFDASEIQSMVASISSLLSSLTQKASDFIAVDVQQIVANDISGLSSPAEQIVNNVVKVIQGNCAKVSSLKPILSSFSNDFSSANSAFSLPMIQIPSDVSCNGDSSSLAASPSQELSGQPKPLAGSQIMRQSTTSLQQPSQLSQPTSSYVSSSALRQPSRIEPTGEQQPVATTIMENPQPDGMSTAVSLGAFSLQLGATPSSRMPAPAFEPMGSTPNDQPQMSNGSSRPTLSFISIIPAVIFAAFM